MQSPLLDVRGLTVRIRRDDGTTITPVNSVSLSVERGKTIGLVGESGSGKSITAYAIARLLPPTAQIVAGSVVFDGAAIQHGIVGRDLTMIFQEPMTALNPALTVERQLTEALVEHGLATRNEAIQRAVMNLRRVGLSQPAEQLGKYSHQLSGGMRQRVMIAMALMTNPKLLIADEPTTALDVTIQAQILRLLKQLQRELGLAIILITHDMGVVAQMAHEVAVMYAGRIVECAPTAAIFAHPQHRYTRGLIASIPKMGTNGPLIGIDGTPPALDDLPIGCPFMPRCSDAVPGRCNIAPGPPLRTNGTDHTYTCIHEVRPS